MNIQETLNDILGCGQQVTVFCGKGVRNSFKTQMSICGTLEGKQNQQNFRILLSTGTYTYFWVEDVESISIKTSLFDDGSLAVISISI